ncbi:MAG: hypothetical protein IPK08_05805 [Bacteroidetes bacterium]|nr:hypothetical protein [Bacteroidota bacterium]
MSQQKNKKDNRDSDYGNSTTDTASTGKTENANANKDEIRLNFIRNHIWKKDESTTTDSNRNHKFLTKKI